MSQNEDKPEGDLISIPYQEVTPEVLRGIIEAFVLQEGTDYGDHEYSLEQKVTQVKKQLERGQVEILYNSELETCNIVAKNHY